MWTTADLSGGDVVPSAERRVLEPASRAPRLQEAACLQTA